MRGLKRKRTPILSGYQIHHNYIRPHESLNGKTPSEACGIQIKGQNKWFTLIQNAQQTKSNKEMKQPPQTVSYSTVNRSNVNPLLAR